MTRPLDLVGKKFNRLTVIERVENSSNGKTRWLCQCECGETTVVQGDYLTSGKTKSCGCYNAEQTIKRSRTHGMSKTSTYKIWLAMKKRCSNPSDKHYDSYGGRGITVCNEWGNFENFLNDMGERPSNLSIDRIDVNGNYCKENCRWATTSIQGNNRRNNHTIEFLGKEKTISEWAEEFKIDQRVIWKRLHRGWSVERTMTTPLQIKNKTRLERLLIALHDAIESPKGVVPDSAIEFYDPQKYYKEE